MKYLLLVLPLLILSSAVFAKPFSFVQFSDPHMGWRAAIKQVPEGSPEALDNTDLKRVTAKINAMEPDFAYCSGDMVSFPNDQPYFDKFHEAVKDLKCPLYVTPGNHDIIFDSRLHIYTDNFGRDYYKFVYNNSLFICLDTCATEAYRKTDAYEQKMYTWLKNNLEGSKSAGYDHIFILCHIPFIAKTADESDSYDTVRSSLRTKYLEMLEKYKVDFVLAGHLHWETDVTYRGTRHICVNSLAEDTAWNNMPKGFRLYKVYPDRVETEWVALDDPTQKIKL